MKLPVTLVLPTLNCREKLIRHLDAIEGWLPNVGEVIAIDSRSTDGTFEVLQERLAPLGERAQILSADRGLYQCWNQAARKATQPCLYYSTICDIIGEEGLREMVEFMTHKALDVIISPPTIVDEDGKTELDVRWPIYYVNKYLAFNDGLAVLDKMQLDLMVGAFLPASIMGSSASNLYRTEVMQKCPFPEEVGSVGDTLWAVRYLNTLRVGIAKKPYASFCWDGVRNGTWDEAGEISSQLEQEASILRKSEKWIGYVIDYHSYRSDHLKDECVRLQKVVKEYDAYVKFLTRPWSVKMREFLLRMTSVRYWLGKIFSRD